MPCITLPAGALAGLPLGIQRVAPYRNGLRLLRIARRCETVLDHMRRLPPL